MTTEPTTQGYHDDDSSASDAESGDKGRLLLPNTTQVPNVILDFWMAVLTGAMLKIVLYVCRRTYGFGRTTDRISVSQIVDGITRNKDGTQLDRGTGLSKSQAIVTLSDLEEIKIIIKHPRKGADGRDLSPEYSLNLAVDPDDVVRKLDDIRTQRANQRSAKRDRKNVGPKTGPSPSEKRTLGVRKSDPQNQEGQNQEGQNQDLSIDHARTHEAKPGDGGSTDRRKKGEDKPWRMLEVEVDSVPEHRIDDRAIRLGDQLVALLDIRRPRAQRLSQMCLDRGESDMLGRVIIKVAELQPEHPWPCLLASVLNVRKEEGGRNGAAFANEPGERKG